MSSDLRDKLKAEIMTGLWLDLEAHSERGALFLVNQELDLLEVAIKISTDDVKAVGRWLEQGSLARPSQEQMDSWAKFSAKSFRFIIVQPYVLIQEQAH